MPAKDFFEILATHTTPPVYRYFDGREWVASQSKKTIKVISPVDGAVLGKIQAVTTQEIDDALIRAKAAYKSWFARPIIERSKILHLAADWLRHHEERLTIMLVKEIGKTVEDARDEILRSADMIDYFANEALSMRGEQLPADAFPGYDKSRVGFIERVPLGVILAIAPFNYPINLSVSKIAPALVTGNAVVFKPPIQGGISSLHMVQAFIKAGVPQDILVCLTGQGGEIGNYVTTHPLVDMITFTGSSKTGHYIAKKAGMIPLLFECGGNNPALVLDDADLEATALEIIKGAFSYSGQRCTAIKYVVGLSTIIDRLIPRLITCLKEKVHMGDPRVPSTKMVGPLISEPAAKEVGDRIKQAVEKGATVLIGGKQKGNFIEPTILDHVNSKSDVVRIETFGPVLSLIRVNNMREAVTLINSSDYGLQASLFSQDEGTAIKLAQKLDVGTVWINGKPQRGPDHFPFLGIKGSGVGVQGIRYTLESMTRLKPIIMSSPG